MRLITVLLIASLMQVSAATSAQSITLKGNRIGLKTVFAEIRKQTGYVVLYGAKLINTKKPVTVDLKNAPLAEAMKKILAGQDLDFSLEEKSIIVKPTEKSFIEQILSPFQTIDVRGKVVDETGNPLIGATIVVKGKSRSVLSDVNGNFSISGIDKDDVLAVYYIGYATTEVNASANLSKIVLKVMSSKLDEVMVIGYGTTTQRLSTGAVNKITAAEIENQPVSNPILALEGKVPGLFITQNAGYAGANMTVSIRGQNSLNPNPPMYVIDGIPFGSTPVEQSTGGFSPNNGLSPLNTINPADIESITVLKDADATAIYGSRGGNGVILITTKKGKAGRTQFNVDLSGGMGKVTNSIKMTSTAEYLNVRKQAFANDGITPTTVNAPDLTLWDQNANTDFANLLVGNTAGQTNAALSVSGGDTNTQFLFGGNYRRESTVYNTNTADRSGQLNLSLQHKSQDDKFGLSVSANYNSDNNSIPEYSLSVLNYSLPSTYPVYNPNGSLYFVSPYTSPLAAFNTIRSMNSSNLIANASFHYMLLPGLDFKTNVGYNHMNVEGSIIAPAQSFNPATNFVQTSFLNNNYIKSYIAEPQLNYAHTWGKGRLTALVGGTLQRTQTVQPYFIFGQFTNIKLAKSLADLTVLSKSSGYTDYKFASAFSRITYEWDSKYLIAGNLRRDGSSRFGAERQFGVFGSIAAAWIFSKEEFIKDHLSWLSFGKVKTSYGTVGNDRSPDYIDESTYNNLPAYGPINGLVPTRIANPYLQWEVTKKFDAAIELGVLNDRIFVSANYYRNRSSNLLGTTGLPDQVGFSSYYSNLPATVQNTGMELELSTVNLKKGNSLTWKTSFNLTIPKNKLVAFPNLANSVFANTYVLGESLNLIRSYHFTGFNDGVATAQDIDNSGSIEFGLNANGKGDLIVAGNLDPKVYGGINNSFSYKGFQLDILFQGVKRDAVRGDLSFSLYPGRGYNIPTSLLDLPLKYSTTSTSAAGRAWTYYTNSDAAVEDASFIRLKNVSLAYNIPQSWINRLRLSSLQIYVRGQNLLTFTDYKGLDPETLGTALPPLKMITAGIRTTF